MTLYLLDANVFIRADGDYYPLDRIPGFWAWLFAMAEIGHVQTPREIYEEVAGSSDRLGQWLRQAEVKKAIILSEEANREIVARVIVEGYAPDLTDIELETVGRDPFLVAAALSGHERVVVTREVPSPKKQRQNRRVPDVCGTFGVPWITDFELWRRLDFRL
jgi:hypothetical protein